MTTQFKPYAAFGTAIIQVNMNAGDTREVPLANTGLAASGNYFYTQGEISCVVKETGVQLQNRTAGWLNTEHPNAGANGAGTLVVTAVSDTEWFCINNAFNDDILPNMQSVVLQPNGQTSFPIDTNFFLARGQITVNGNKTFTGPCQVRVRNNSANVTNNSANTVYGLIIS
jgi:hypothetical protein